MAQSILSIPSLRETPEANAIDLKVSLVVTMNEICAADGKGWFTFIRPSAVMVTNTPQIAYQLYTWSSEQQKKWSTRSMIEKVDICQFEMTPNPRTLPILPLLCVLSSADTVVLRKLALERAGQIIFLNDNGAFLLSTTAFANTAREAGQGRTEVRLKALSEIEQDVKQEFGSFQELVQMVRLHGRDASQDDKWVDHATVMRYSILRD